MTDLEREERVRRVREATERMRRRAKGLPVEEPKPLPKPISEEPPPAPWQDREPGEADET